MKQTYKKILPTLLTMAIVLNNSLTTNITMVKAEDTLPSSYDGREYCTSVKQQDGNTCSYYATAATVETSLVKSELENTDINVSEDYWYYGDSADPSILCLKIANQGVKNSDTDEVLNYTLINTNTITFKKSNENFLKQMILDNGAFITSYFDTNISDDYILLAPNSETSYFCSQNYEINHAISVVGWDDNFSKENFKETPSCDGAWLCKNSWGNFKGSNGYFWMSYDTATYVNGNADAISYKFADLEGTTYSYENDSTSSYGFITVTDDFVKIDGATMLTETGNAKYSIDVYINPILDNNTIISYDFKYENVKTNSKTYGGYQYDTFDKEVFAQKGDTILVKYNKTSGVVWPNKITLSKVAFSDATSVTKTSEDNITLTDDETVTLTAKVVPSTAMQELYWSSSDETIATVDQTGKVKGLKDGTCKIYATSRDKKASTYYIVTIKKTVVATDISILTKGRNSILKMQPNQSVNLLTSITPSNVTNENIIWTVEDKDVARMSGNMLIALNEGTTTVTATCGNVSDEITLSVINPITDFTFEGVTDNTLVLFTDDGYTYNLNASVNNDATVKDFYVETSNGCSYSKETGILTVDGIGTYTITFKGYETGSLSVIEDNMVTSEGGLYTETVIITVTQKTNSISASKTEFALDVGKTSSVKVTCDTDTYNTYTKCNITNTNPAVATVVYSSNGYYEITALSSGTTTVTITPISASSSDVKAILTITVKEVITGVEAKETVTLTLGETYPVSILEAKMLPSEKTEGLIYEVVNLYKSALTIENDIIIPLTVRDMYSPAKIRVYDCNKDYYVDVAVIIEEEQEPSQPTEPEEPVNPDTPEDPSQPETPTEPEEPVEPEEPTNPEDPEIPTQPSTPEEPTQPSTPTQPEEPTAPNTPDDDTVPVTPGDDKKEEPMVGKTVADTKKNSFKITSETTVTFVKNTKKSLTVITIPDTIKVEGKTYKVTQIAANAVKNNKKVTKVTIGKNVTTIGKNAFYGCTKLKTVTIGKNVTTIGDGVFKKCTSLTKISLPSKVKKIGKEAFSGCKKLGTITIKSKVLKSVGKNAIKGIKKNAKIDVPNSKKKAYKKLFKSSTGFKKTMNIM